MAGDLVENQWKDFLKIKFPQYFSGVRVLDIGSADINGTNKPWFEGCKYIGIDIKKYKNVNVVAIAHKYKAPKESFDTICSTSQLEHDMHWQKTLKKMVYLLKPSGFMFFACGYKREPHGTKDLNPLDSLTSERKDGWENYYGNLNIEKVRSILDLDKIFSQYQNDYTLSETDMQFWGIKKL